MVQETVLACDVGGTRLRVALVGTDGTVYEKRVVATPSNDPGALPRMMIDLLAEGGPEPVGAVVGMPGIVDYSSGQVLSVANLPAWEGHVTAASLGDELGTAVLIANDADLAALGEHRFGAGVGTQDMLYVTVSTGVGAGVILGGRLLHGCLSLAEVGHTIMDRSSHETVESLGSGTALARLAGEDAASVAARAQDGDADAMRCFASVAGDLAIGVFNAVRCFSPEIVVIGGGMAQAGDLLLDPIRERLKEGGATGTPPRTRVVLAKGGDDVALKGAAAYWSDLRGG